MSLEGKNVVLLVSGGIAAYKAADLTSKLRKRGANVRVAMSRAAAKFVQPLTFEAICGHPIYREVFDQAESYRMEHIEWARWADALLVAPASADFLARMAQGLADDAPLTLYLAYRGPVFAAPAMNTAMWEHPATRHNVALLSKRQVEMIGPGSGTLACGEVGEGRMAEPEEIIAALEKEIGGARRSLPLPAIGEGSSSNGGVLPLSGRRVLITAGPTRESLDPIRFISNRSSGRMGVALGKRAAQLGASVVFIHGPLSAAIPEEFESIATDSAQEMLEAVQRHFPACDVAIFAAAVANYRPADRSAGKLKGGDRLTLELIRNPDIAAWAGSHRAGDRQVLVGFAAESEDLLKAAQRKLEQKGLDLIFANPIGVEGIGFQADDNEVTMLARDAEPVSSGRHPKAEVAAWIWDRIGERLTKPTPAASTI